MDKAREIVSRLRTPSELNAPMEDVERAASFVAELADVQHWCLPMRRENQTKTIMGCDTICFMETCIRCAPLIKLLSLAQNEHALVGEHEFMTHFNAIMQHENHDGLLSLVNETYLAAMLGMAMTTRGTDGVVVHNERVYWRVGMQRFGWWIHEDQKQFARITIRNVLMMPRASSPSPPSSLSSPPFLMGPGPSNRVDQLAMSIVPHLPIP